MSYILLVAFYIGLMFLWTYHDVKLNGLLSDSIGNWKYLLFFVAVVVYPITIICLLVLFFIETKKLYNAIRPMLYKMIKARLSFLRR